MRDELGWAVIVMIAQRDDKSTLGKLPVDRKVRFVMVWKRVGRLTGCRERKKRRMPLEVVFALRS